MALFIYLLFYLATSTNYCDAYRALVVYPMPAKSHGLLGDAIVKQLLKDGNEVTYIRCFEYKNPPPNLRQIDVSANADLIPSHNLNIKNLLDKQIMLNDFGIRKRMMITISRNTLENEQVKKIMSDSNENFDVVIVEWMFNEVLSGLAAVFGCPLVWMCPTEVNPVVVSLIDAIPNPAYTADGFSTNIAPFTLQQRIEELWFRIQIDYSNFMYSNEIEAGVYYQLMAPHIQKRGRQPPAYDSVKYNASLVLGNSHVSMGEPHRLPQSYKHIGGYHIEENQKSLTEELKSLIENSKQGVIYFSMGSNLKSKDWPQEIKQGLLKMFGKLQQTVLWKFEEDLPNVPRNVHILKWAPQQSILSHPNCVLFISHGGLLSTIETIHYGVPIIGIPVFGDQFVNVKRAVNKGFALKVDLTYNITEGLSTAIKEILSNPTYTNTVKELSYIYHDRPMKPAQEMSHWVRHVVNTRGASHLRSVAKDVPLYQRLYLDLFALLIIALIFIFRLLRLILAMVCSKKISASNNKKKD